MRVCDFLAMVLQTQGEVLKELLLSLPEWELSQDDFMEALERAHETPEIPVASPMQPTHSGLAVQAGKRKSPPKGQAYQVIAHTVTALKLPEWLEFYVWSYPFYRNLIESDIDIQAPMSHAVADPATTVEAARSAGERWVLGLGLPPERSKIIEDLAQESWLRFRAQALRGIGRRPLQSI